MERYKCKICGNEDINYFGINNKRVYCRKCISFHGKGAIKREIIKKQTIVNLDFSLSKDQEEISTNILKAYINRKNVLLNAVCGAGKTELVYKTIAYALSNGKQVGFVIPRKDVVIDLYPRIKKAFSSHKVVAVYGGHNEELEGDIIILTSHQLYRYNSYFDYLIMDEADAFPYYNNLILNSMFKRSLKGNYLMMSATSLKEMENQIKKENGEILYLNKRYHGHPLPVPKLIRCLFLKEAFLIYQFYKLFRLNKPIFVFCPTINECERIFKLLNFFFKNGDYVHSKRLNREKIIRDFKDRKIKYLVTTSVLERGVTVKDLQVIIYNASSVLFDEKALIQIAGRVGRKSDAYDGEVILIGDYVSKQMEEAKRSIERSNSY